MTCGACGAAVAIDARFCASCGHDLTRRGDERRIVTVLFADLVGFTTLSETRDPEQIKNLIDHCFERLVADIAAFDGRVDKIIGDAIVALFGAPVAHEDDAERAVRAALQMQRTITSWASSAGAADLQMRIGINTGEVLVGALRAGGDYTAMGDVVNTANRLQTAATPGRVLVGPATHAATRQIVQYSPLGPIQAKGRDEPVEAWIAEDVLAPPGYRPNRLRTPLVGRDVEVSLLSRAVDSAIARKRAHLLLVVAEAGMGKTRLAEEVAAVAECTHNAAVLEGRCVPYGEANVWWPVAEALRYGCSIAAADPFPIARERALESVAAALEQPVTAPEVERITTGLLHLMGFDGPLQDIDPVRAREEVTRSLLTFLEAAARQRPVITVLSDLHWADDQVLEVLDLLLERVVNQPVVIVATARHTLEDRWTPKPGRHNVVVLNLDPLDRESAADLLNALLESEVAPEVRDLLLDRSGGNPFFLEELVSLLSESGVTGARAGHLGSGELPDTLRGLVAARLDGLTPDERRTLGDAAVLGRRGSVKALETMAEHAWGIHDIGVVVEGLVAKEILVVENARWSFRSDLVREVTYGTLTKADRARRHAGIAKFMEQFEAHTAPAIDRIAHHYGVAAAVVAELGPVEGTPPDLPERALFWLEKAAKQAEKGDLHVVAARLFGQAIDLEDQAGERRRRLLLGRARALCQLRDLAPARDDVDEALEEAEASGEPGAVGQVLLVLGDIEQKEGDLERSSTTLDRAATIFRELDDRKHLAEALRNYGMTAMFGDRNDVAQSSFIEALELFRDTGDRRGQAWVLQNLAWLAYTNGRADEAEARLNESASTFSEIGDAGGLGWALGLLAFVRFHQGRYEEAEQLGERMLIEARERGDRWAAGMMLVLVSSLRLWTGRAESAIVAAQDARELFQAMGDFYGDSQALGTLARAYIATGRIDEGFGLLESGLATAGSEWAEMSAAFLCAAAAQAGDPDRSPLDPGPDSARDVESEPGSIGFVDLLVSRGLLDIQQGRPEAAVPWMEAAVAGGLGASGYACSGLALAYAATGRTAEAIETADQVEAARAATYADRLTAQMAKGLALAAVGDAAGAAEVMDAARVRADGTEDRLMQAVVRLAEAQALETLGDGRASAVRRSARDRLSTMSGTAHGWQTAFRLASGNAAGAAEVGSTR